MPKIATITSFNRYPKQKSTLFRPERYHQLKDFSKKTIARGQGKSYGDAALNEDGNIILMERLNRFLELDLEKGLLTAEAGVTIKEVLDLIVPKGWFLPVVPGTSSASLGGCVAADVHGKNHFHSGSFANHINSLELISAQGATVCSSTENKELFWATVGGLGLTGIIGSMSLQLKPIKSPFLDVMHQPSENFSQTLELLNNSSKNSEYAVAWLDCLNQKKQRGRGIITTAKFSETPSTKLPHEKTLRLPLKLFSPLLNSQSMKLFNEFYYYLKSKSNCTKPMRFQNFFFPLDKLSDWNELYGRNGFLQYQCLLPFEQSEIGLQKILNYLQKKSCEPFLAVLKNFGAKNPGYLSFPFPGVTLAMDFSLRNKDLFKVLDSLDDIVVEHHGRIYLAKDARLSPEKFQLMYPGFPQWKLIKNQIDPEGVFSSSLSRRIGLTLC